MFCLGLSLGVVRIVATHHNLFGACVSHGGVESYHIRKVVDGAGRILDFGTGHDSVALVGWKVPQEGTVRSVSQQNY